jgi:hypothetical protein
LLLQALKKQTNKGEPEELHHRRPNTPKELFTLGERRGVAHKLGRRI